MEVCTKLSRKELLEVILKTVRKRSITLHFSSWVWSMFWVRYENVPRMLDRKSNAVFWRERKRDLRHRIFVKYMTKWDRTHLPGSSIFCVWSSASTRVKNDVEVDELGALRLLRSVLRIRMLGMEEKTAQLQMGAETDSAKHFYTDTETC